VIRLDLLNRKFCASLWHQIFVNLLKLKFSTLLKLRLNALLSAMQKEQISQPNEKSI